MIQFVVEEYLRGCLWLIRVLAGTIPVFWKTAVDRRERGPR